MCYCTLRKLYLIEVNLFLRVYLVGLLCQLPCCVLTKQASQCLSPVGLEGCTEMERKVRDVGTQSASIFIKLQCHVYRLQRAK